MISLGITVATDRQSIPEDIGQACPRFSNTADTVADNTKSKASRFLFNSNQSGARTLKIGGAIIEKRIGTSPEQAKQLCATLREALGKIKEKQLFDPETSEDRVIFSPTPAADWTREKINAHGYQRLAKWLAADAPESLKIGIHDVLNTLYWLTSETESNGGHRDTIREAFDGTPIEDRTYVADVYDADETQNRVKQFVEKNNLTIRITPYPADMQTAPPWVSGGNSGSHQYPHGIRYRITISHVGKPGRLVFDFWDSIRNREILEKRGKAFAAMGYAKTMGDKGKPTHYDVLSCISSDSYCSDTFTDWCSDMEADTDSRKSLATWKRCRKFAKKINSFFSDDELAALREIQ